MESSLKLEEILKSAIDSLYLTIIIDENEIVRYISESYSKILNLPVTQAIGKHVKTVVPDTRTIEVLRSGKADLGSIYTLQNGDITVCNRLPIKDSYGEVRGVISTATFPNLEVINRFSKEIKKLREENKLYQMQLSSLKQSQFSLDSVIGNTPQIAQIKDTIGKIANSELSVLITGETGTGKEVFANAIHQLSNRRHGSYVKVNCAAIPKDLLESELFGYDEGAFSGAKKGGKPGKFEQANNGTILLDEISEMPLGLQSKLLRVLQEKEFERVGGNKTINLNVRVISASNQNIEAMVEGGIFRRDLYYRINVIELALPSLRERLDDLPLLCEHLISKINTRHGCYIDSVSEEVLTMFYDYNWPGNVRELEHVLERASVLTLSGALEKSDFDFFWPRVYKNDIKKSNIHLFQDSKQNAERRAIKNALETTMGNKTQAAKLLGISRSLLYEKLKKYKIEK